MSEKPAALRKLLGRTLFTKTNACDKPLRHHKVSKADVKARQRRREEIKQQRANSVRRDAHSEETRAQNVERLSQLKALSAEQQAEIERLQDSIADELIESVTFAKQQLHKHDLDDDDSNSDDDLPSNWRGLPPGLAPIGYEPDSSDDEPY